MSNKKFNIRCIGCDTEKSEEMVSKIEYHICNNCINRIDMYLQNKRFTNDKFAYYNDLNYIKEKLIYDNCILLNCTNCKIAIKRRLNLYKHDYNHHHLLELIYKEYKNKYKNMINLCFDCFENRKDLIKTKTDAIRDFFVTSNDLINLRHNSLRSNNKYCKYYNIYYTSDLIKIRDQKYDQATIAKLIDKRDKLNEKRKERNKIKKISYELRKKEIIKECNNCAIEINDDDLNNEKIIDYLKKGKKSKHNLNDIIEFLSEEIFLIYNTDFLIYLIMENNNCYIQKLISYLNYITYSNIKNTINKYKSKIQTYINITEKTYNNLCIMLDNKQYIDDDNLWSFIFTYIDKTFSINNKKQIYKNMCAKEIGNNVQYIAKSIDIAKSIAITKIYENNKKINLPGKLSDIIILDKYNKEYYFFKYKDVNKLSNEIYEKYIGYVKNIFPMFERDFLNDIKQSSIFNNIEDININKPVEIKLVKKNDLKIEKEEKENVIDL